MLAVFYKFLTVLQYPHELTTIHRKSSQTRLYKRSLANQKRRPFAGGGVCRLRTYPTCFWLDGQSTDVTTAAERLFWCLTSTRRPSSSHHDVSTPVQQPSTHAINSLPPPDAVVHTTLSTVPWPGASGVPKGIYTPKIATQCTSKWQDSRCDNRVNIQSKLNLSMWQAPRRGIISMCTVFGGGGAIPFFFFL